MLIELARIFLKLGTVSFGGPLAHIALMHSEFVDKRGWLSEQEFLDLNGAVNIIPGPNSTELAMHIGHRRAGNAGIWVAGLCFITPAFVLVLLLSALYSHFGQLPQSQDIMWGISPIVVAIVGQALLKIAPNALKSGRSRFLAILALLATTCGINEITVIFTAGAIGFLLAYTAHKKPAPPHSQKETETGGSNGTPAFLLAPTVMATGKTAALFWSFLKIGSVIYGSGYVLLAYMRAEFVDKLAWISDRQLLDAVAIGQMTPGPLFTSATFVGYQIAGLWGGVAATVGIFAPSFLFVMLISKSLRGLNGSPRTRTFLDCVNAASFTLMVFVTVQLAVAAFIPATGWDIPATLIGLAAAFLLWKTPRNPAWILLSGAAIGLFHSLLRG